MKRTITILLLSVATISYGQNTSSSARQSIELDLSPVIQINTITAEDVSIAFSNANQYANGVQSTNQEFKVSSNEKFVVSVKTDATNFSYSGSTLPAPVMPVNILKLALTSNNTGGNVSSQLGSSNYMTLSSTPTNILTDCDNGAAKTFAINYKATPGNAYPAGIYTVGVVYTATQP
ncbi:MAG: hypothetical protein R2800_06325 [Flavipsychrobacter sp.]